MKKPLQQAINQANRKRVMADKSKPTVNTDLKGVDNYTPAPWDYRYAKGGSIIVGGKEDVICTQVLGTMGVGDIDANGRLIAAAPDLLHALRMCLGCTDMNLDELDDTTIEAIEVAQAAVKKATGG